MPTYIEIKEKEARNTIFGKSISVYIYSGESHAQHKGYVSMIVHPEDLEFIKSILYKND